MTTAEIKSFSDVLLFELQKKWRRHIVDDRPAMLWAVIWHVCADAAPKLRAHAGRARYRDMFVSDLFFAIEQLESKRLIKVIRRPISRQNLILRIELINEGKSYLEGTIFTHQSDTTSGGIDNAFN